MSFRSCSSVYTGPDAGWVTVVLSVCLLVVTPLSFAQQPTDANQQTLSTQVQQNVLSLQQTVAALEAAGDTWHPLIAETMVSLAQLMQGDGNHTEALGMLERAVHISRVNNGLFSLEQAAALDMQVKSHMALQQWAEADTLRQYHFYIHSRALAPNDPELIPALLKYAEWHLQTYTERRVDVMPVTRVVDAYQLYSVALSIADSQPEPAAWPRERFLQRMAYIAWQLSLSGPQMRPEVMYARTRQVDDEWVDRMTGGEHKLRPSTFLLGEDALKGIIAQREVHLTAAAADSALRRDLLSQYVEAVLQLADWNLLFNRRQGSADIYQQAWQLVADEDDDLKREIFGKVVFIPAFDEYLQPVMLQAAALTAPVMATALVAAPTRQLSETGHEWPWVDMKFDLTRHGRVSNVELLNSSSAIDEYTRRRVITGLRDTPMRPIVSANGLQASLGWVYRVPYDPAYAAGRAEGADEQQPAAEAGDDISSVSTAEVAAPGV